MEVDFENHLRLCLAMDEHGPAPPRSSGLRVSTKSRAPSPPGLKKLDSPGLSQWYPGNLTMDQKENLIDKDLSLVVVLPDGVEKMTTVHGSKPLMDLLVMLCAKYHLNPSSYTLELVTANRHNVKLKPNALIGTLDAEKIILKPKGEDKNKKTGPQMPEATVRMVINYKKSQKTILRVNPRVPLSQLLPAICEKCEFEAESTVLLRDVQSVAPLDLSSSLNDYAIREVYARDTRGAASPVCPASPAHTGAVTPGKDKDQKEKENKGLFSKFRKSKKTSSQATTVSAPASPVLVSKPRPLSMALPSSNSSSLGSPAFPADAPKKRRAPQPPILVSQSCSSDLGTRRRLCSEPGTDSEQMSRLSRGSSAESSLKRTKRKAPPPPTSPGVAAAAAAVQEALPPDESAQGAATPAPLEEIMEQEETPAASVVCEGAGDDAAAAAAAAAAGDDSSSLSLSLSGSGAVEASPPPPGRLSAMSVDGPGEDHAHDLSSDGNLLPGAVDDGAVVDERTTAGEVMSELEDGGPCLAVSVSQLPPSEESTTESVKGDGGVDPEGLPPSAPRPAAQDAEAQGSAPPNTESLGERPLSSESAAAPEAPRAPGEDAQVQTDLMELPEPPPPPLPQEPPSQQTPADNPPPSQSTTKRDMATLTEKLDPADLKPPSPGPQERPMPPCPAAATKAVYAAESEPKPKPSNELTRDYIPKVGMTTYTIVPQKSLEKLRYYEVELTLEAAAAAGAAPEGLHMGSLQLEERAGGPPEPHPQAPPQALTTATHSTVNGVLPESGRPSPLPPPPPPPPPTAACEEEASSQAGSPAEVKEVKIPPATKPKPGSFRLAKHKKTPGYYVTSAAEKSPGATSPSAHAEDHERAKLPLPPPPPPPQQQQQSAPSPGKAPEPGPGAREGEGEGSGRGVSSPRSREPTSGLSLEKLRSFAAPRPYSPSTPSRFAQAVSSAVKRTQSVSQEAKSPRSPSLSPLSSPHAAIHSPGVFKFKDNESGEAAAAAVEGGVASLSEVAHTPGVSGP